MNNDIQLGDPAIDLANGRALIVLGRAADRADEWSERESYDLLGNYGNERLGTQPDDTVWTCVYVASLQSEPSRTYDFPESRLGRPAYERADGDGRVYDRVAQDVLVDLLVAFAECDDTDERRLAQAAEYVGLGADLVAEAQELAAVEQQFGDDDA